MARRAVPKVDCIVLNCQLCAGGGEREIFIDNLLVRIHFIIEMIPWTGLAPWGFEFPFPGSLISTVLGLCCTEQSSLRRGATKLRV